MTRSHCALKRFGAGPQLGRRMGVLIERGEFAGGFFGAAQHHLGQHDFIEKACGGGGFTEERIGQPVAWWYADGVRRSFIISKAVFAMVILIATSLAWML